MQIGTMALAGSVLLLASVAPSANGAAPADATGVIKGRESGMLLSAALMGSLKGAIDRGDEVKPLAFAARSIANWAAAIPGMFPAGSEGGEALPTVWSDRAGFEAQAAGYKAAADRLVAAAGAGDKAAFAAAFGEVRASCASCHATYKAP